MISGIILASGFSRRMGKNKLLLKMDSMTIIEKVVSSSISSYLDEIILVTQYDEIIDIFKDTGIKTVKNENPERGLSNSIVLGVKASSSKTDGYVIILGDMPWIEAKHLNELIKNFYDNKNFIIVPKASGIQRNPVLFPSTFKDQLTSLTGDSGGKKILRDNPNSIKFLSFYDEGIFKDIDTESDYKEVLMDEHF